MTIDSALPAPEKEYLRDLAKKLLDYSRLPVMAERKRLWYLHNRLAGERPMVVMEEDTFIADILPPARCEHPLAARVERQLLQPIAAYETFDDDKVLPDFFPVYYPIGTEFLGQKQKHVRASEGSGFHIEPVFETLEEGLPLLRPSVYRWDRAAFETYEKTAGDLLGDLLPVVRKNSFNYWFLTPTQLVVNLMGMENMYCAMMSEAEDFHRLMRMVTDDLKRCLRWQEEQGLLVLNNGNDYMGSGSFCFSDELPGAGFSGAVRSRHLWGHINSQESIGISPEQFAEFVYPYYEELAGEYGLVYYGCCEPVHAYWDTSLCRLPNLRKISISPWCDEEAMAERLSGGKIIYSRKPSPNFIGIKAEFDEEAFTAYIQKTAAAVKGRCKAEFIFRDIYTLRGNLAKTRGAVEITRRIAEGVYCR
ncbi:MAG: hypothetical protein LBF95_07785 [Treponema sp.]|jgi:hypothetical protein|nr:hypothetical protein [Treponema sp.]